MNSVTSDDVKKFILNHFTSTLEANGLSPNELNEDFDLLKAGVIDSFGVIEMISAVETHFGITVDFEAMDPDGLTILGPFSRYVADHAITNR